ARHPGRRRYSACSAAGVRVLAGGEESGKKADPYRHTGRIIKLIDRARQRVLGIFRATPGGGGRLAPIDKKQLGHELSISAGAGADARDGDLGAGEVAPRRSGQGLPSARVAGRPGSVAGERAGSVT